MRGPTQLLHRGVKWKETLLQELVHHVVVLCLNLRDHVARNETHSVPDFRPVEAVCVFIPKDLMGRQSIRERCIKVKMTFKKKNACCASSKSTDSSSVEGSTNLDDLAFLERQLLVGGVRVRRHGHGVVVEESHEHPGQLLRLQVVIVVLRAPSPSVPVPAGAV